MSAEHANLPIQAMVDLLVREVPEGAEQLRRVYPSWADRLVPGKQLGQEADIVDQQFLRELAEKVVSKAREEGSSLIHDIRRRQHTAARFRLMASLIAALASGGLLAAVLQDARTASLVAAAIAFVGTSLGLVQQYFEEYSGGADSLRRRLESALQNTLIATQAEGELQLMVARNDYTALEALIRKLNSAIASNRQIELALS